MLTCSCGKTSRDLSHDPGVVAPDQPPGGVVAAHSPTGSSRALDDDLQALGLQQREVGHQRVESLVRDFTNTMPANLPARRDI